MDGTAHVPRACQRKPPAPEVGGALRSRLAAQLDAALAAGGGGELFAMPSTAAERRAQEQDFKVRDLFITFDKDEDEKLNEEELEPALEAARRRLQLDPLPDENARKKAVRSALKRYDLEPRGGLDLAEFTELFRDLKFSREHKLADKLLERPVVEKTRSPQSIDAEALHKAAENGDIRALAQMDPRLRRLLEEDEDLRPLLQGAAPSDPRTKAALQLYRDSFRSLEASGRDLERDAFQAVMRDDVELLEALIAGGLPAKGLKNAGGATLLELARERGKLACEAALVRAGLTE